MEDGKLGMKIEQLLIQQNQPKQHLKELDCWHLKEPIVRHQLLLHSLTQDIPFRAVEGSKSQRVFLFTNQFSVFTNWTTFRFSYLPTYFHRAMHDKQMKFVHVLRSLVHLQLHQLVQLHWKLEPSEQRHLLHSTNLKQIYIYWSITQFLFSILFRLTNNCKDQKFHGFDDNTQRGKFTWLEKKQSWQKLLHKIVIKIQWD